MSAAVNCTLLSEIDRAMQFDPSQNRDLLGLIPFHEWYLRSYLFGCCHLLVDDLSLSSMSTVRGTNYTLYYFTGSTSTEKTGGFMFMRVPVQEGPPLEPCQTEKGRHLPLRLVLAAEVLRLV